MNNRNFLKLAEVFGKDSNAEEVIEAGEKALVCLYNGNDGENINHLRLRRFKEKVAKKLKVCWGQIIATNKSSYEIPQPSSLLPNSGMER